MTRDEYDLLKKRIAEQYRQDLEALERIWKLAKGLDCGKPESHRAETPTTTAIAVASAVVLPPPDQPQEPQESQPQAAAVESQRFDVLRLVRDVLPLIEGSFSVHDVCRLIFHKQPEYASTLNRSSVTSALNRLVDVKEISLVLAGAGKRASVFSRQPQTQETR